VRRFTSTQRGLAASLLALACAGPVQAGRACNEPQDLKPETVDKSLTLAWKTLQALDASGAKVVVMARAGQDLSKYGVRYSHLGFAYREDKPDGGHVWRVLHKLNLCGTAESAIYRQGLGEFFLDDLWHYEAAWVALSPQAQTAMLRVLLDAPQSLVLHQPRYNMVAYPWSEKYQQSNQWAIETLAYAMTAGSAEPVSNRAQAQGWLQRAAYRPTTLTITPLVRLGARMTKANVAFDDHPDEKRFSDRIETVTVDSVFAWLKRANLSAGDPLVQR
jgi:hypothetical protein